MKIITCESKINPELKKSIPVVMEKKIPDYQTVLKNLKYINNSGGEPAKSSEAVLRKINHPTTSRSPKMMLKQKNLIMSTTSDNKVAKQEVTEEENRNNISEKKGSPENNLKPNDRICKQKTSIELLPRKTVRRNSNRLRAAFTGPKIILQKQGPNSYILRLPGSDGA